MNKTAAVLEYMRNHKGISNKEAVENFGEYRLASKIFSLRKQGYEIESVERQCIDCYGHKCSFVEYRLISEKQ